MSSVQGKGKHAAVQMAGQMLITFGGWERTEMEYRQLLHEAGFNLTSIIPAQAQISIIEGVPV